MLYGTAYWSNWNGDVGIKQAMVEFYKSLKVEKTGLKALEKKLKVNQVSKAHVKLLVYPEHGEAREQPASSGIPVVGNTDCGKE